MHAATGGLLALTLLVTTGCAVGAYGGGPRYGPGPYGGQRVAFDRGYHDGLAAGERDARYGRRYDYHRDRQYRDGLYGYDRRLGPRDEYRHLYRSGFESGYRDGYARAARYPARRGRVAPGPYGYGPPVYGSPARERGLADGYAKGLEDRRDRDRFDPRRHRWYRSADRGYRREYGSKDAYARVYRDAFIEGYERGYRTR